jgi:heme o synthase
LTGESLRQRPSGIREQWVAAIDPSEPVTVGLTAEPRDRPGVSRTRLDVLAAYVSLTKPRIIELLLVTTIPAMLLAAQGWPDLRVAAGTLVGGALAAAGANTMNSFLDRDIDAVMHRTGSRPLATGVLPARNALIFGGVLSVASIVVLLVTTNVIAAALGALAIAIYVVGYTIVLKRRTSQNIVWGGAAGCMPVLIGWSAVTGSLAWTPFVMFLVVFFWTPPHYWPLSMRYKADYAAANVPMLPVVADNAVVADRIIRYAWAMVAASLALIPVGGMGLVYSSVAVVLGGLFMWEAYALRRRVGTARLAPLRLFHGSITYLSLLFLAIGFDPFIG